MDWGIFPKYTIWILEFTGCVYKDFDFKEIHHILVQELLAFTTFKNRPKTAILIDTLID